MRSPVGADSYDRLVAEGVVVDLVASVVGHLDAGAIERTLWVFRSCP